MKNMVRKLNHAMPYLRLASFISRGLLFEVMMETDGETVQTMKAVMLLGKLCYEENPYPTPENADRLFLQLRHNMTSPANSMEAELEYMLNLQDFRKYIDTGMGALGIY